MKCIIIRCWFINSEDFIKEIIDNSNIRYEKVPNVRQDVLGGMFMYTDWFFSGDKDIINNLIKSIENTDHDIEIITDILEILGIVWRS